MKKNRTRRLSVLLIPDDNAEPYSFRLNLRIVRLLVILGLVLVVHIIMGGYAYYRWYKTTQNNLTLIESNKRLLEDNKRIYLLDARFEDIKRQHEKVLRALGVDAVKQVESADFAMPANGAPSYDLPADAPQREENVSLNRDLITAKSSFIARRNSRLHEYTPNLPTFLPVEGYLTADFEPNNWLAGRKHPGIDIAARRGRVIVAAGAGMVVFAGWTSRYGNIVIINHGDNIISYYAHNSKLLVRDRSFVRKGEPIALLGSSGTTSTGPHLHFEIWRDGVPVNPREFLFAFHNDERN